MKTIRIKVTKQVEELLKQMLPYYVEHGWQVYKIISENKYISAYLPEYHKKGIEIEKDGKVLIDIILNHEHTKEITEERFKEAYEHALSHINHEALMQTTEPATEFDIQEKIHADCASAVYDE